MSNIILKDVVFYYAKVQQPAPNFGKTANEYSVQCLVTKEDMQKLKGMKINKNFKSIEDEGLLDKFPEGKGRYMVSFKMPEFTSSGKALKPAVVGTDRKPMTDLIGNGSKGQVKVFLMEGTGMSKGKMNARLSALMIETLVEYKGKGGDEEDFDFKGEVKRIKEDMNDALNPF